MAATFYECRDTAKRILGDSYHEHMEIYGETVKSAANALNCSEIAAGTTLANRAGGGMAAISYLAAVVEMTEPSNVRVEGRPTSEARSAPQGGESRLADALSYARLRRVDNK